jgi:hypothetical protein
VHPVLRLEKRERRPLYMPLSLLTKSAPSGVLLSAAVGIGALVEALALGFGETGKIFGLLILSAALTAIAQQTLP